ncbi:hypothetical protein SAMN05216410_2684 [Sanguibacter gelidistatuariae]|uniref:Phosphodiesterase n=1 Tax=Sanguibacter gelidistatuariae TaxID=1814289 RepID=A0A1G6RH40_9MICO|nr:DUF5998 family protein [Sanguibacter gelidistatuariae]SDD03693.1 hypothetical protein SAMN05216410_2684 [Sanguibacter gelidistatuariae]
MSSTSPDLRTDLHRQLNRAGYYPDLVADVLDVALADEPVEAHLVHVETTFTTSEVRRHVTVLVLTASRLVLAHVDDHSGDPAGDHLDGHDVDEHAAPQSSAAATTEAVPLAQVKSVVLTHMVNSPENHVPGAPPAELTLAVGWGAVSRIDLEPAQCPDPQCEADHGLTGSVANDDVLVRISAQAEGQEAVRSAVAFAKALSAATGHAARGGIR